MNYDGFTTVYTPGTRDTVRDFVDELNSIFPETTATIDENGVLTFHIKSTHLDGESQPSNLTGSISFTAKDGTVWTSSVTSEPRVYVTTTIIPTSSTKLGEFRDAKDEMTFSAYWADDTDITTYTLSRTSTIADVISIIASSTGASVTLENGILRITAEDIVSQYDNPAIFIRGDVAELLNIEGMGLNFTFKNVDTISGRANGNHMSTELLENFFNEAHSESGEY